MKKTILTITGPSLSGKSTLEKLMVAQGLAQKVTSFTSRVPRTGEVNGVDYYFMTKAEIDQKEIAELTDYNGNFYGITRKELETRLDSNQLVVVVVEPHGAKQLKAFCEENGILCVRSYINNPLHIIKERFDLRKANDLNATDEVYDSRWKSMMTVEKEWGELMKDSEIIIPEFTKQNEQEVIESIMLTVASIQNNNKNTCAHSSL